MTVFTASNGAQVVLTNAGKTGYVLADKGEQVSSAYLGFEEMVAWREFEQQRRDAQLGRWRWPENPDFVVHPKGDGWIVLSEVSANSKHYSHREHASIGSSLLAQAMRAYFDAHPERKPWHDAKTGEVWVITVDGEESAWTVNNKDKFENPDSTYELTNPNITAARRIWPVSDD